MNALFRPLPVRPVVVGLLLVLLLAPRLGAQHAVGLRIGFNTSPSGLTFRYALTDRTGIDAVVGHTKIMGKYANGLMARGHLVTGALLQRRFPVGDNNGATGFYAQGGARLRFHLNPIAAAIENEAPAFGGPTFSPEAVGGGGFYLRMGALETYAEMNMLLGNPLGQRYGLGWETALGLRLLLQ